MLLVPYTVRWLAASYPLMPFLRATYCTVESTVLYGSSTVGSDRCSTGTAKAVFWGHASRLPPSLSKERGLSLCRQRTEEMYLRTRAAHSDTF
jgi:hypothetical protein